MAGQALKRFSGTGSIRLSLDAYRKKKQGKDSGSFCTQRADSREVGKIKHASLLEQKDDWGSESLVCAGMQGGSGHSSAHAQCGIEAEKSKTSGRHFPNESGARRVASFLEESHIRAESIS
jgi:hypothetical protein